MTVPLSVIINEGIHISRPLRGTGERGLPVWERNEGRDILLWSITAGDILGTKVLEYSSNYILLYGHSQFESS